MTRHGWTLVLAAYLLSSTVRATIDRPDTSLSTFPTAYYGANWNRSAADLELLSRIQIVVLMQEDGPCWRKCCPNSGRVGRGQCGAILTPGNDSTAYPGCGPSCDQMGTQQDTFRALKAIAHGASRRPPHCMMYLNSVYLWPFDKASSLGDEVKLLDVHGRPHAENCDPGIFPSFFWSWDRPAGRAAWQATVNRTVLDGAADGAYVDCFEQIPLSCNETTGECTARRNGGWKSINEVVTRAQVEAYKAGKLAGLATAAGWVTAAGGSWFGTAGGNLLWVRIAPPATFVQALSRDMAIHPYIVVSCHGSPWNNPQLPENMSDPVQCTETCIAQFLLAVEPGAFLLCGGMPEQFLRPLGNATKPAVRDNATGVWTRGFPSGTRATFDERTGTGTVAWTRAPAA